MTLEEIRKIAINSAQVYYKYLEDNGEGYEEIQVSELSYVESSIFLIKLKVSKRLFDLEAIWFRNKNTGEEFDVSKVKIVEYDRDNNILLINPVKEIASKFKKLEKKDLILISDLKFLVRKVEEWYERNGTKVLLPINTSKYKDRFDEITYFDDLKPSENQKESLYNIFSKPFSYVWGAPGTGKTQFVLSYAIMHYINKNDKVAILAPTNNSIEQVLRGVLSMTDKAKIDRKKILRLGAPSKKFAEKYPEVCEQRGLQKEIEALKKQIKNIDRVIDYRNAANQLSQILDKLSLFDNIDQFIDGINSTKTNYEHELENRKRKEIDLDYAKKELDKLYETKKETIKKLNSFGNKIKKFVSSKNIISKTSLFLIEEEIKSKYKEVEFAKYRLSKMEKTVEGKERKWKRAEKKCFDYLDEVKSEFFVSKDLYKVVKSLSIDNWKSVQNDLNEIINQEKDSIEVGKQLSTEYVNLSIDQLIVTKEKYLVTCKKLAEFTTEERLRNVNVIACTLDGYIGRYIESTLDVDHIFVDEAGYANAIKTLTLFNHRVPLTLLGDHKQLPPVCKIRDEDIAKNKSYRNIFLWSQSCIYICSLFEKSRDFCLNEYLYNSHLTFSNLSKTSLNSTFRFGNNLAKVLANYVYDRNFQSANIGGETKIYFINAKRVEKGKVRTSINEAIEIVEIVKQIRRSTDDYVILTPYNPQVNLLKEMLYKERNEQKILTVHGSQGREWHTVILSVVDTTEKWFVNTACDKSKGLNLVNTAVSRAKDCLIVVCDKGYWINQEGQLITELLKIGKEIKCQ